MEKLSEEKILEVLGTDPREWIKIDETGDQFASMVSRMTGRQFASMVLRMTDDQLASMVLRMTDDQFDSIVSSMTDGEFVSMVSRMTDGQVDSMVSSMTDYQKKYLEKFKKTLEKVPLVSNLYSSILRKIEKEGGRLKMSAVHHGSFCGTTHCLAGWTIVLAEAQNLEKEFGWQSAATLIHKRSHPNAPLPNYFASNEAGMAYLKARAAEEK